MKVLIRIKGIVDRKEEIENTMDRLRLRRKYACVLVEETPEIMGMVKKLRDFIAYGDIDDKTLKELIEKRGQKIDKNKPIGKLNKLDFESANLKPFFRLHPPRKGINSKQHFPNGALGDHKEKINDLIRRML